MLNNNPKKHLGRGLQSLLGPITSPNGNLTNDFDTLYQTPNHLPVKELDTPYKEISLDAIRANPYQPRTSWNDEELEELAISIKESGVIQPIIVRPTGNGFELIAGERRFRASKIAGRTTIPAIVRQATDEQLLEFALIENIHRSDLNPIERAKAYQTFMETFSLSQTEAAEKLGENRSVVANFLRLLSLPAEIKQMLMERKLSMGHARAILALPSDEMRRKLANRVMAGQLSVREVEKLVQKMLTQPAANLEKEVSKPAYIVDLENSLTNYMGTKTSIETRKNGQKGKITIEFYSLDEFDRIIEKLGLNLGN
jgi:ParB family transcriptional regulator, chromosome partitioning protein